MLTSQVTGGEHASICVGGTTGYVVFIPTDASAATTVTPGACAARTGARGRSTRRACRCRHRRSSSRQPTRRRSSLCQRRAGAIPVLLFHSVCATTGCTAYNATPTEFARIMLMLQAAGYQTISLDDYAKWWHGQAVTLPAKPILITFDDGRWDAWRGADSTLAALGDQVTMFDATGWTDGGEAKFLRWNELEQMQASGRWDVQLHAGQGHVNITPASTRPARRSSIPITRGKSTTPSATRPARTSSPSVTGSFAPREIWPRERRC